jgi:mannose-6-phosphate isomerase-like protein (cupin superfamily)
VSAGLPAGVRPSGSGGVGEGGDGVSEALYPDVELAGAGREDALRRCREQLEAWNLGVPGDVVLALHFGLDEFDRIGLIEFWVANETQAGYCGKRLFLFDGQTCPEHLHRTKHETFFVLKGQVRMVSDGRGRVLAAGERFVMPPGVLHRFTGVGPALVLEVSMPSVCGDNFFTDTRIGRDGVLQNLATPGLRNMRGRVHNTGEEADGLPCRPREVHRC